ncbi:MAG TPA: anthranilate synthase component I family protein [Candidatus Limnocylindrales bacterium]|nr:anthranilate synthase component I family protein [Candidatus Limnocylindrales bacterium]
MSAIPEARPVPRGLPVLLPLPALAGVPPIDVAEAFRDLPGLALLESARPGRSGRWSFLTADPVAVLDAPAEGPDPFAEARALLARLDGSGRDVAGLPPFAGGLVGYLGYDLGRRLERLPALARVDQHLPVMRLALHEWAIAWDRRRGEAWLAARAVDGDRVRLGARVRDVVSRVDALERGEVPAAHPEMRARRDGAIDERIPAAAPDAPGAFVSGTGRDAWVRSVEAVRDAIGRGEIYQANLARRLEARFAGDPWPLFRRLRTGDPALFAGYLDLGASPATGAPRALLSASPEPFLAVDADGVVTTDPIKGTRQRGRTREQDRALARELLASAKDQAENVMIVDVLRNDLGRVCEPGSVTVPRLLRLERTAAVQHLVTTVTGRLRAGADAFDLLAAAFPGGSITGAPKIRAMELIETLEPVRRGPYCGAMVWLGPDGRMGSSILIRTFVADGERLTLHVGGGITWRSDPAEEWAETVAKARGPLSSIGAVEVTT